MQFLLDIPVKITLIEGLSIDLIDLNINLRVPTLDFEIKRSRCSISKHTVIQMLQALSDENFANNFFKNKVKVKGFKVLKCSCLGL